MKIRLRLSLSLDTHRLHAGEDLIVSASGMGAIAAFFSLLNAGERIVASEVDNGICRHVVECRLLSY